MAMSKKKLRKLLVAAEMRAAVALMEKVAMVRKLEALERLVLARKDADV